MLSNKCAVPRIAMKKKTISLKRVGKMYRIARMSNCLEIVIDTRTVTVHDIINDREAQILIDTPNLTISLS